MITDNLSNGCNSAKQKNINDRVKNLEDVINGYDENFNSRNISTQNLTANNAKIANIEAAGIKADNADVGALTADSLDVTGAIKAKSFVVDEPVIVNGLTTDAANIGTVTSTDVNSTNANIKNLTVENLMTSPDSSLEYKNLSVTNQATINKLNLVDPHLPEVISDNTKTVDLEAQNIKLLGDGKISRLDTKQNIISMVDGATILGDTDNDINIAGKSRPKWNDAALATLSDIITGSIKPVYRGRVDTYDQLPMVGNAIGDLYIVENLTIADKTGIGTAMWNGESWDPSFTYELALYATLDDAKKSGWTGTKAEFDEAKKNEDPNTKDYLPDGTIVNITDDVQDELTVSNTVQEGDFNPVSSDAVFKWQPTSDLNKGNMFGKGAESNWESYSGDINNAPAGRVRITTNLPHSPTGYTYYLLDTAYYNSKDNASGVIFQYAINATNGKESKRYRYKGVWSEWQEIAINNSLITAGGPDSNNTPTLPNSDFNKGVLPGTYVAENECINGPYNNGDKAIYTGVVYNTMGYNGDWVLQTYRSGYNTKTLDANIWMRRLDLNAGVLEKVGEWRELATTDMFDTIRIPQGYDLNNYNTLDHVGKEYFSPGNNGVANSPFNNETGFGLKIQRTAYGTFIQIATSGIREYKRTGSFGNIPGKWIKTATTAFDYDETTQVLKITDYF